MSFSIFIADSTTTTSPAASTSPARTLISVTWPEKGASSEKTVPAPPPALEALGADRWSLRSSTHVVCTPPRPTSGCARTRSRNSLFTLRPSTTKSSTALRARPSASAWSAPRTMSLAIIGSYAVTASVPEATELSTRTPPGSRYSATRPPPPGSKPTRTWMATPSIRSSSCRMPRSPRDLPAATRSCSCTRSSPATSSVMVCSTWMRGFNSKK
mmetsp:Transcript_27834/g.79368  ORF Transcript_27834/g.79368 Transcript_27834/m.79368 type:complete len:214 (-) Transcript_27834:657-1298(-)